MDMQDGGPPLVDSSGFLLDHVAMTSVQQWRKRIMTPAAGWVFALACLLAAAIFLPRVLIGIDVGPYQLDQMTADAQASAINSIRSALLQGIGGAAVIAAAYIAWRQLRHNIDDSRSQRELERQAKLTEWFNNAVEHLGSTELATRLGGIYALDRIGRDSAADRRAIVDILAAYVRMASPWPPPAQAEFPPEYPLAQLPPMRVRAVDVQAALTVLGRWGADEVRDDIWPYADLTDADLRLANLAGANLLRMRLHGANLARSNLIGADLRGADLEETTLHEADLSNAIADETTWWPDSFDPHAAGVQSMNSTETTA